MNNSKVAHNSKEFFIDDQMILIRPLAADEDFARQSYIDLLKTNQYVAIGECETASERALSKLCEPIDNESMVYVAHSEGRNETEILGLAIYIKSKVTKSHDMGVLVKREYADSRLAFELTESLTRDASEHRALTIYTTDDTFDTYMSAVAEELGMSVRLVPGKNRRVRYTLQVDEHPVIPKAVL